MSFKDQFNEVSDDGNCGTMAESMKRLTSEGLTAEAHEDCTGQEIDDQYLIKLSLEVH